MTKYDIRLRRKSLTSGQIERHKDFKGLYKAEPLPRRSENMFKVTAIIVALLAIAAMIIFGVARLNQGKNSSDIEEVAPDVFDEFKQD